ncbi:hypothetical protein [Glaciecola sp. 1036]|uniref:hypothetical protein n=1 Tax=Alteromonadaceae TaxID=72275 RepID=UPI003D031BE6
MKKIVTTAALLFSTLTMQANAEVNFSGFGSIVGGIATDSDIPIRNYSDDINFKQGSFFALQAYSDLSEGLSATMQIRARGRDDWDPEFTWAYLSYEVNDSWRIQLGRQRIPMYLYSDYLDVSFAYHWITPPTEVYKAPFDSINGIGSIHDFSVGDANVNLRVYFGQEDFTTFGNDYKMSNILSGVISVNYGSWTFRSSALTFTFEGNIGLDPLIAAWQMTPFPGVGTDLEIKDDKSVALEFGVIFDNQDWLFVAEYIPSQVDETIVGDYKPWMVSVGKRFDNFMLHATVGEDVNEPYRDNLNNVPVGLDPSLDALYYTTKAVLDARDFSLPFYSIGLRWDFHPSAAFKTEYTHSEVVGGEKSGALQAAVVFVF